MLLVLLTMTSGCVDAISFLALGQVFTAAMTGNTVLFGLAVVHTGGLSVPGYAFALLGFVLGAAVGATILGLNHKTNGWGPAVTVSIGLELVALVLFAIITTYSSTTVTAWEPYLLIAILAFAMGVQGVAARRIGVTGVTTTVITSTLTGLVESLIWKLGASLSGNNGDKTTVKSGSTVSILSISMWILVIVAYGVGAAICGALEHRWHFEAIWLPIAFVSIVVLTAIASGTRITTRQKAEISM
jgi:uncharacterized membrane protein YoaK (UPF0700 family)